MSKPAPDEQIRKFCEHITQHHHAPLGPVSGWRSFVDGEHILLEPRDGIVTLEQMSYIAKYDETRGIEAVFRSKPHPGVYLSFRLVERSEGLR